MCRPDLTDSLGNLLSEVNKDKHCQAIAKLNQNIRKFHKLDDNKIVLQPMNGSLTLEVYADSSFKFDNQQGVVSILREAESR